MNEKALIDDKISRFSYLNSYTIYWGDGIWYENGDISNVCSVWLNLRYLQRLSKNPKFVILLFVTS